jgi:RimJ/RimL family protein N-acetyltransferase
MSTDIFQGELVRLVAVDVKTMADAFSRWSRDSAYWRLLDSGPTRPFSVKTSTERLEKELGEDPPDLHMFMIKTLQDEHIIGEISLDGVQWQHGECFIGVGIGNREDWGQGYGTDAMRIILRYAFEELNLERVSLNVFSYNQRAIRVYEKLGFKHEGVLRESLHRDHQYSDMIYLGILRSEWLQVCH